MFEQIDLSRWRQFEEVSIKLDSRMTVLTGENGTGKTTILNILSRHFGWNLQLVSTPISLSKRLTKRFWSDVWSMMESDLTVEPGSVQVGAIRYRNGNECQLMVPRQVEQAQYNLTYQNQQMVLGLHIRSHGPNFTYQRVDDVPANPKTSQQQYEQYQSLLQQLYTGHRAENPGATLKKSLIALAVFGYGNRAVVPNPEYERMFAQFQHILSILLPRKIGFREIEIRMPDIVFKTDSGDFSLDAASGGVGALVGLAWQVCMYGADQTSYVVTIDEPETHLHPSMQRELLPNLFRAFPDVQFVIATHSPFVATSSPDAKVYALVYNESHRVYSQLLEAADLAGSANETLREILGVPMSFPVWVEQRLDEIVEKYRSEPITLERLKLLKAELASGGLQGLLPDAIDKLGGNDA